MTHYLPFAIQGEIMKRLPTRSLMQFRSVCKQWRSLIDSSNFIADYSFNHTHQEHLLVSYLVPENYEQKYISYLDFDDDDDSFPHEKLLLPRPVPGLTQPGIVGSSQGLFCMCNTTQDSSEPGILIRKVVLWNPSIRKSLAISVPDLFDRQPCLVVLGFGVCPHTGDPKLVNINFNSSLSNSDTIVFAPWRVEVYTLSSGAWRSIPTVSHPRNSVNLLWQQVVTDEFIYWLAIDCVSLSMATTEFQGYNMLVSFDLTSETFMEVALPRYLACVDNCKVVIIKIKKSLAVVEAVTEAQSQVYDVWMMECGVPNTFTKLFSINSPDVSIHSVLGFRKNNEPIFDMTLDYNEPVSDMGTDDEVLEPHNEQPVFDMGTDEEDDVLELESEPEILPDASGEGVFVHQLHSEHMNYVLISGNAVSLSASSYMETLLLFDH